MYHMYHDIHLSMCNMFCINMAAHWLVRFRGILVGFYFPFGSTNFTGRVAQMDQVVIGARSFETAWLGKKVVHLGDFCDLFNIFHDPCEKNY